MSTVYMLMGIPGAGKTTWIKNNLPGIPVVSRDLIREELGIITEQHKQLGTPQQEREIKNENFRRIEELCEKGVDFAIDNTHVGTGKTQTLSVLREHNVKIVGVNVITDIGICIERRKDCIPRFLMESMYDALRFFTPGECDEIINVKFNKN